MEEYTPDSKNESSSKQTPQIKRWLQDNLRIIISAVIVVAIAGGIYSYSNREVSNTTTSSNSSTSQEEALTEETQNKPDATADKKVEEKKNPSTDKAATVKPAEKPKEEAPAKPPVAVTTQASQETADAFVQTAGRGDGLTTLARQATANYLEKNPDSALTKEHKIYIEDYLRKNVAHKGGVGIGTSVEFSKDLVQKAIAASKNLNEKQLKNLQKYSARVSSL
ncbi:MAG: hypothetical protein WCJ51_00120 [Candidatus Moraniibacteriota bacterium]